MLRTSGEATFELSACMSVFKKSRIDFSSTNKRQMRELLGEIRSEVAFNYNHELANILNDSATSDVPPVRDLFCWYVGCYQYTGHPANAGENYGRCLSRTGPRAPYHGNDRFRLEKPPPTEDSNTPYPIAEKGSRQVPWIWPERSETGFKSVWLVGEWKPLVLLINESWNVYHNVGFSLLVCYFSEKILVENIDLLLELF